MDQRSFREKVVKGFLQLYSPARVGAVSVYTALTTSLIAQLVAAQANGGPEAVQSLGLTLGGGVLTSLVANHLYDTKDEDKLGALNAKIEQEYQSNAAFREEVSLCLASLNLSQESLLQTLVEETRGLTGEDKQWFEGILDNLREELAALMMQDANDSTLPREKDNSQSDVTNYLQWLEDQTETLNISLLPATGAGGTPRLDLMKLYIELQAKGLGYPPPNEGISLQEAVKKHRCVEVVGPAGSGKSTFLSFLVQLSLKREDTTLQDKFPLLFRLVELVSQADAPNGGAIRLAGVPADPEGLVSRWCELSTLHGWGLGETWFKEMLERGRLLVLLDGLDEAGNENAKRALAKTISDAAVRWQECRWVVTSRPEATPCGGFHQIEVRELEDSQVRRFAKAWARVFFHPLDHLALKRQHALIRVLGNPELEGLRRNPLTLTTMANLVWNTLGLSDGKRDICDELLKWFDASRPHGTVEPDIGTRRECYESLALAVQEGYLGTEADLDIDQGARSLAVYFKGVDGQEPVMRARAFLEQEETRRGIIYSPAPGRLAFVNPLLQNYLAASVIVTKAQQEPQRIWPWFAEHCVSREKLTSEDQARVRCWFDTLRFVLFRLLRHSLARLDEFLVWVLRSQSKRDLAECVTITRCLERGIQYLSIDRSKLSANKLYQASLAEMQAVFTALENDFQTRRRAAIALGIVGDPRFEDQADWWVTVPGGTCWVGAQSKDPGQPNYDEYAIDRPDLAHCEAPVYEVYSGTFAISRFPVTVQEFERFIRSGGYQDQQFWSGDGLSWLTEHKSVAPRKWERQRLGPNCPVTGVTGYEAEAYCAWLNSIDEQMFHRLPTEAEWEFLARSGNSSYRRYVCGNEKPSDPKIRAKIHCHLGGRAEIAPVGLFPDDQTADGAMDINGNISEWLYSSRNYRYPAGPDQADKNASSYPEQMAVRGSSWNYPTPRRLATRMFRARHYSYFDLGFRVLQKPRPLAIKGQRLQGSYDTSLADLFAKTCHTTVTHKQADAILALCGLSINMETLETILFPVIDGGGKGSLRLPCLLREAPPEKLDYNLRYQDSHIKLAVEAIVGDPTRRNEIVTSLTEAVSTVLWSRKTNAEPLWKQLTDYDCDAIVRALIEAFDPEQRERLLESGYKDNNIALRGLSSLDEGEMSDLVSRQVFAGVVPWHAYDSTIAIPMPGMFSLLDLEQFLHDVAKQPCHMAILFDDNGEFVWDLMLVKRLLQDNPKLKVTAVLNELVVANNANVHTFQRCLESEFFRDLRCSDRLHTHFIRNHRTAIDLKYCSRGFWSLLSNVDLALIKGTANFETLQNLPCTAYYAFVATGLDIQICTGLPEDSGVFVRLRKETQAYKYGKSKLVETYLQTRP